ncbi:glyoxalase [Desulfosarcina alkanivorans]|uniref:Glyoxalase n=1 Tax=Desulfosarcina alkanivorans TaxID=571177 RepID=A0A5K7YKD0_9BACT|nr:VOC family protein [Desulfosarcina alkanivorans]BBO69666.1 glyoxalase [Desulfosarcina alkanivorans]
MKINSLYPVICTDKVKASKGFYITHFNFKVTFDAGWYVSLRSSGTPAFELAFLDHSHPSVPDGYRQRCRGMLINMEVSNVDKEYERLMEEKIPLVQDIRSEVFGQRHCIIKDPNGILIDLIQNIPPSAEFLEQYK